MPRALWDEATVLAEELGASAVKEALTLNRTSLLRRMEEYEGAESVDEVRPGANVNAPSVSAIRRTENARSVLAPATASLTAPAARLQLRSIARIPASARGTTPSESA